jgi:hypothetical protein
VSEELQDRLRRAEVALEDALAERNRLWEELNARRAAENEVDDVRRLLAAMEASPSWRITAPLRSAKAFVGKAKRLAAKTQSGG